MKDPGIFKNLIKIILSLVRKCKSIYFETTPIHSAIGAGSTQYN